MKVLTMAQGSVEWAQARIGIPTASNFDCIITPSGKPCKSEKTHKYLYRLAAERILNRSMESLDGLEWIERGKELEPDAVKMYEFEQDLPTSPVGIIISDDGRYGASPDRLVGNIGLVEIKCPAPHTHVGYLLDGFGTYYAPQVQGQLLLDINRDWVDRYSYSPEMPPYRERTQRDRDYILVLKDALERFCDDLDEAVERLKKSGMFLERSKALLPADAEYEQRGFIYGDTFLPGPLLPGGDASPTNPAAPFGPSEETAV